MLCLSLVPLEKVEAREIAAAELAAVGRLNHAGYRQQRHCTAVLVAPQVALTAEHCLTNLDPRESHLLLGYNYGNWREHLRLRKLVALGEDLAALCLARPATTKPLPISDYSLAPGQPLTAAGYGRPAVHRLQVHHCQVTATGGERLLRVDCPLAPGNSGGPLLDDSDGALNVAAIAVASGGGQSLAVETAELNLDRICPAG
ncbi:MAG: serine protease [Pseudomonadota bacterium]